MEISDYFIARANGKTVMSLKRLEELAQQETEGGITISSELPMNEMAKRIEELAKIIQDQEEKEEEEMIQTIIIDSLPRVPLLDDFEGDVMNVVGIGSKGKTNPFILDTIKAMEQPKEMQPIRKSRTEKRKEQRKKIREERRARKNGVSK